MIVFLLLSTFTTKAENLMKLRKTGNAENKRNATSVAFMASDKCQDL